MQRSSARLAPRRRCGHSHHRHPSSALPRLCGSRQRQKQHPPEPVHACVQRKRQLPQRQHGPPLRLLVRQRPQLRPSVHPDCRRHSTLLVLRSGSGLRRLGMRHMRHWRQPGRHAQMRRQCGRQKQRWRLPPRWAGRSRAGETQTMGAAGRKPTQTVSSFDCLPMYRIVASESRLCSWASHLLHSGPVRMQPHATHPPVPKVHRMIRSQMAVACEHMFTGLLACRTVDGFNVEEHDRSMKSQPQFSNFCVSPLCRWQAFPSSHD